MREMSSTDNGGLVRNCARYDDGLVNHHIRTCRHSGSVASRPPSADAAKGNGASTSRSDVDESATKECGLADAAEGCDRKA